MNTLMIRATKRNRCVLLLNVICGCLMMGVVAHAELIELEGWVRSIDKDARTISVVQRTAKGEKTFDLEVAKGAGDLGHLTPGRKVFISYDPDIEVVSHFRQPMIAKNFLNLLRSKGEADGGIVFGYLWALADNDGLVVRPTTFRSKLLQYLEDHPEKADEPASDVIREVLGSTTKP